MAASLDGTTSQFSVCPITLRFYGVEMKTGVWEKWLCKAKPLQPSPLLLLWGRWGMESREKWTDCSPGKGRELNSLLDSQNNYFFPHLFPRSTKHGRWEKSTFLASLIQACHLETSLDSSCYTTIVTEGWLWNPLLSTFVSHQQQQQHNLLYYHLKCSAMQGYIHPWDQHSPAGL